MKQYFINLFYAIIGRNPYQSAIDDIRHDLKKSTAEIEKLRVLYDKALAAWEKSARLASDYEQQVKQLTEKKKVTKRK